MIKNSEVIVAGLLLLLEHYIEKQTGDDGFRSFNNPVFSFQQFVWDCNCEPDDFDFHEENCPMGNPNFLYKPTNFSIEWYKHIGRSMEYSNNISVEEFYKIINTCILSLSCDTSALFWKEVKHG